jgi:acyl-coenzyme A synthetase/AMP-(fatty) acid ligase
MSDLLATEHLGAGNFFRLAAKQPEADETSVIELDKPYQAATGRVYNEITLAELDKLTDSIASGFYQDNIRPKDPVAIFLEESVRYLIHYISLTKIGAIPVFVNGLLDPAIATKFITHVGAVAIVSEPARLAQDCLNLPYYVVDPHSTEPFRVFTYHDNEPVLIAHTSGTTGVPKAVQFSHDGFFYGIKRQIDADLGKRILSALPQSHASAISVLMSSVARGARVMLITDREPERLANVIQEFQPNLVAGFPKVFVDLCRINLNRYDLSSISRWMSTGDANHERHVKKLIQYGNHLTRSGEKASGSLFIDNFGSSEFGFAMFRQVHSPQTNRYGRCIGRAFDWVDVRILDDNDEPVGSMTVGRLALKSPSVTAGYWNNTLLSEKNRVAGYWLTGDLAYQDEDGLYYHVDRVTDRITTRQGTMYSCHVEELIMKRFGEVFDCSLVGVEGPSAGQESPLLTVDLATPDSALGDLHRRINDVLADEGLPSIDRIMVRENADHVGVTGKALKRTMRAAYEVPR